MIKTFFTEKNIDIHTVETPTFGNIVYDSKIAKSWLVNFQISKAKEALIDVYEVAKILDLQFFLVYGTALGVYREKNFIEHDYDIDLGIYLKDKKKLIDVIKILVADKGFKVYKISELEESIGIVRDNIPVEFGLFYKKGDNYLYDNEKVYNIPALYLNQLDKINFLDRTFYIPHDIENYLKYQYGKDWNIPIKDFHNPYKRYISRPLSKSLAIILPEDKAVSIADSVANFIKKLYKVVKK
jgi:hypothetical protein